MEYEDFPFVLATFNPNLDLNTFSILLNKAFDFFKETRNPNQLLELYRDTQKTEFTEFMYVCLIYFTLINDSGDYDDDLDSIETAFFDNPNVSNRLLVVLNSYIEKGIDTSLISSINILYDLIEESDYFNIKKYINPNLFYEALHKSLEYDIFNGKISKAKYDMIYKIKEVLENKERENK